MKFFITGAAGQLGSELCLQLGSSAVGAAHADLDIANREAVLTRLADTRPDVVINAAAYTKVDLAEREQDLCYAINSKAVAHLVEGCKRTGAWFVQISTDYLFGADDGATRPRREDDPLAPQGIYAKSKALAEENCRPYERHTIVRTCGLYGHPTRRHCGPNFVDTMLRLGRERGKVRVVADQVCTPSYVRHVASAVRFLAENGHAGTFHVTNTGEVRWADFAAAIFEIAGITAEVEPITTVEYGAPAPRPRYSVLDTSRYQALTGPALPAWREALTEYLEGYGQAT